MTEHERRERFAKAMAVARERYAVILEDPPYPPLPPATAESIDAVEHQLGVTLPGDYRWFLENYGGGIFLFVEIRGVQDGEYSLADYQTNDWVPPDFLAISPNGCGDDYGFRMEQGRCEPALVWWDHETDSISETSYDSFLDFVIRVGLRLDPDTLGE